jgi:fumarylacetoacetate (FAA) hydrolase family protein
MYVYADPLVIDGLERRQGGGVERADVGRLGVGAGLPRRPCARDHYADAGLVRFFVSRGKSYDTFLPLGPAIVTTDEIRDVQSLKVTCIVNGEILQDVTTEEMIHSVAFSVSYASRLMTLEPGDLILTGTPHGVGFARNPAIFLVDGDVVEVEVEGVGVLCNPVRGRGVSSVIERLLQEWSAD